MATIFSVPAKYVATAHTSIATSAFTVALLAGWLGGNWKELCKNSVARESGMIRFMHTLIADHMLRRHRYSEISLTSLVLGTQSSPQNRLASGMVPFSLGSVSLPGSSLLSPAS